MTACIIEVSNLVRTFEQFVAVDHVSFAIPEGEIFALVGPNGAGKTTIIRILATLLRPTAGSVMLNGFDVVRSPHDVRRSLGIVFQDQSIDAELTAAENMDFHGILYGMSKPARRARTEELLQLVQLWHRRDEPLKYFSGGMKRRLEIARGLMHSPKILVLDEPTTGLDPQTRNSIWSYLVERNKTEGMTVCFASHQLEEAEKFSRKIAIVERGSLVEQGDPKAIMARTKTNSLEEAVLSLTGTAPVESASIEHYKQVGRDTWRR